MELQFTERIRAIPVSRILLCSIAGIYLGKYLVVSEVFFLAGIGILLLVLALIVKFSLFFRLHTAWIRGVVISLIFIILAWYRCSQTEHSPVELPAATYIAEVNSLPVEKERSVLISLRASILNLDENDGSALVGINVYFEKSDSLLLVRPGDYLLFFTRPEIPVNTGNPDEFDYVQYLRSRGIYYRANVQSGKWLWLSEKRKRPLTLPMCIKQNLLTRINDTPGTREQKAVLAAITLGTRDYLDPELKSAYANAGAIHVMAVSGLHVGMIWMFLGWITAVFGHRKTSRVLRFIIITGILWMYALMTGLSPSVTRSCLMFTMVSLGRLINRNSGTFNTVLVAAFLQLWLKPSLFFDAGFRFSYLAVLGILLFHAPLISMVRLRRFIPVKIRDLLGVSLAAQILTFPLGIYYFHQFPVWFLLTNLFIIPLVTILVLVYLFSVLCFFVPAASFFVTRICLLIAGVMNNGVSIIDGLPFSVADGLYLNVPQVLLLLILPLLIFAFIRYRRPALLIAVQVFVTALLIAGVLDRAISTLNEAMLIYNIRGMPAVSIISGGFHKIYTSSGSEGFKGKLAYAGSNFWLKHYVPEPEYADLETLTGVPNKVIILPGSGNILFEQESYSLVIISDNALFKHWAPAVTCSVDFVIIATPDLPSIHEIQEFFTPEKIIVTSSVPPWKKYNGKNTQTKPYIYDVRTSGYFLFQP